MYGLTISFHHALTGSASGHIALFTHELQALNKNYGFTLVWQWLAHKPVVSNNAAYRDRFGTLHKKGWKSCEAMSIPKAVIFK